MSGHRVMVSFSRDEAVRLESAGPLRDLLAVAAACDAEVVYRSGAKVRGWRGRLLGSHVRQAWRLTGDAGARRILADGEHTGVPLLLFSALRRRRTEHVTMIGHLVSKPWKLAALTLASRLGPPGTLVLHSVEQQRLVRRWLGPRWRTALLPYQVDTSYWSPASAPLNHGSRPLVLGVGAENRDYGTLLGAVDGLEVDVVIAAGSHWARNEAVAARALPANVRFLTDPLPFAELRELYRRATCVAVPLEDVSNQSGVTVILEAMACGVPVVVTATRGQRECITGPLVTDYWGDEGARHENRGPSQILGDAAEDTGVDGLYVKPGDVAGLRRAIALLSSDPALRNELSRNARASAVANFDVSRFITHLLHELKGEQR